MSVTPQSDQAYYGLFNDSYPPILDGVTLTVENYVRWLKHKGLQPCVVTPRNPVIVNDNSKVLRYFSLPIHNRKPYRYGYPKLDPLIWHKLRATPFRLVHAHCPFSSGRLAVYVKRKQHVPLIGTFHSKYRDDLLRSLKYMQWCVPFIIKRILDFLNACDEVWIPQAAVEETVREYGFKGKLTVVDNGIDFADIPSGALASIKEAARKKLNIAPDEISLLFVGQHIMEKGIDVIVNALALAKKNVRFRMNFIGDGYARHAIEEIIIHAGLSDRVKFNGIITDRATLRDYYAASDLFLFPSFYDNAPLVVREAAALGTPSVLLKGSTAAEVIRDNFNGFLCGRSPEEYAAMLRKLSAERDTVLQTGINARNTLVRSWEDVVDEVADRYKTILKLADR